MFRCKKVVIEAVNVARFMEEEGQVKFPPQLIAVFQSIIYLTLTSFTVQLSSYVFLPARRYASAGLCDSDVSVRLSVCLSVRHTLVLCLAERKHDREMYTV